MVVPRQEEEDRGLSQETVNVPNILEEDPGEVEDTEDDEDTTDEREIWKVSGHRRD